MKVSFDGINNSIVTFLAPNKINIGDLVSLSDNNSIKKSSSDESFLGVCVSYQNGLAGVQISGFASIKMKSISNLNFGRNYFVSDDDSSLKLSTTKNEAAIPLNVISIDKENSLITVIL